MISKSIEYSQSEGMEINMYKERRYARSQRPFRDQTYRVRGIRPTASWVYGRPAVVSGLRCGVSSQSKRFRICKDSRRLALRVNVYHSQLATFIKTEVVMQFYTRTPLPESVPWQHAGATTICRIACHVRQAAQISSLHFACLHRSHSKCLYLSAILRKRLMVRPEPSRPDVSFTSAPWSHTFYSALYFSSLWSSHQHCKTLTLNGLPLPAYQSPPKF